MERRIRIKRKAFTRFIDGCDPPPEVQLSIWTSLQPLKHEPLSIGAYRVLFHSPDLFQVKIGNYTVNYDFDDEEIQILWVGILGVCP